MEDRNPDSPLCPVEIAARIIGQKWTLQIVHSLLDRESMRFCELQEALGGVNPSTLSSRLKMLEEEGMVQRLQISDIPPHVEYSLTAMGAQLEGVIDEIARWSRTWLCPPSVAGDLPAAAQQAAAQQAAAQQAAAQQAAAYGAPERAFA